jgi:hypothetical protein
LHLPTGRFEQSIYFFTGFLLARHAPLRQLILPRDPPSLEILRYGVVLDLWQPPQLSEPEMDSVRCIPIPFAARFRR